MTSNDRLSSGLSFIWLAATLGPGSARFKKISKKELLKCDVTKACQKLIEPDEPLALRLSSNLMLGVTRVYNQQCSLLHQDTTTTHTALRAAIVHLKSGATTTITDPETGKIIVKKVGKGAGAGGSGGGIDQEREKGREGVINLRRDEGDELMLGGYGQGLFGGFDDMAWQMMEDQLGRGGARQARLSTADAGVGDDFETHSIRGDDDEYFDAPEKKARKAKAKEAKQAKATVAKAEDINLPAHLNMEEDQYGLALDEQNFGFEANLVDENFVLGLDDVIELPAALGSTRARSSSTGLLPLPSLDRFPPAPSSTSAGVGLFGREGLPPSPPHEHDAMMGGFDGNDFGLDLGLDAERAGPAIERMEIDGEENVQIDENDRQAKKATPPRDESVLPTPPPSAEKKVPKKKQAAKKKKPTLVQDAKTTLESEDLAAARDAYTSEMKKANAIADQKKYEDVQQRRAGEMMTGVPRGVGAPDLVEYFKRAYSLDHLSHAPTKRDAKGKKTAGAANDNEKDPSVLGKRAREEDNIAERRRREREGTAVSSAIGRGGARAGSAAPGAGDYEGYHGGDDYQYGGNDFDIEQPAREESAAPSVGGRGRAPSYLDESNIGRNRERAASVSYSQQMPWMQPFQGEEGFSAFAGGPSSFTSIRRSIGGSPGRFGVRSRSSSVSNNNLLRDLHNNRRSATPSVLNSQMGRGTRAGTPDLGGMMDFDMPGVEGEDEFKIPARPGSVAPSARAASVIGNQDAPPGSQASVSESVSIEESEGTKAHRLKEEGEYFLVYAKRNANPERDNELFFSDIVPITATTVNVAVSAFYQVLVLASRGKMKVKSQEEPYGEILLSIQ